MSDTKDKLIEQAGGVLEKAYDDIVHNSAKSVGNTLSLLPRTIGVWLGKWEKWVVNGEESIKLTALAVREKASQIPYEKLSEPEPYVAVPTIQQLSYCYDSEELREMYANLLISSMNVDTKYNVHPSFVDIIKQITPDEAKLLKRLSQEDAFPLIDIKLQKEKGYNYVLKNFTNICEGICDCPNEVYSYLDNFERLKLINILPSTAINNDDEYKILENDEKVKNIMNGTCGENEKFVIERHLFYLTDYGKNFIHICL